MGVPQRCERTLFLNFLLFSSTIAYDILFKLQCFIAIKPQVAPMKIVHDPQ